jgi:hypothetical protein
MHSPLDIYQLGALPPVIALIAVGSVWPVLGGAVAAGFARARRRTRLAATAEASVGERPPPLVEGSDVVLVGTVRHFEDHDVAVKVSVRQSGTESESSGSWSHAWTEIDREIILAPFLLELADGKHVLVHPPKNVDVADALDQKVWIDRNQRVLSAELVPGERIFARGRLERSDQAVPGGAYRDVAWGWALGPTGGQMLLSSEPLGQGLRKRASFHRYYAWIASILLAITQLTLAGFYGRLAGDTELATLDGKNWYQTTDEDDNTDDHYKISLRGRSFEIDEHDFNRVGRGIQIPVRIGSANNWEIGSEATIHWMHALVLLLISSSFWIVYKIRRATSRPWFRRKVNESGGGRLPDPP